MNKIIKAVRKPRLILKYAFAKLSPLLLWMDDETYIKLSYRFNTGRRLNLNQAETFNEKIQWIKLNIRDENMTALADKYLVREYVKEKAGEKYLIPLLKTYSSPEEISFSDLPDQFVMKCTHDSGGLVVCPDKNKLDRKAALKKIKKSFAHNYYYEGREWAYKGIVPRIIVEKYMVDESGCELKDYKFFCFQGEVKMIQVDFDRFTGHKRNLYTTGWKFIDASIKAPSDKNHPIKRPENLKEMIEVAQTLSAGFLHVRVDLYTTQKEIYFGELTFYHGSGYEVFKPRELEYRLGRLIDLNRWKEYGKDR